MASKEDKSQQKSQSGSLESIKKGFAPLFSGGAANESNSDKNTKSKDAQSNLSNDGGSLKLPNLLGNIQSVFSESIGAASKSAKEKEGKDQNDEKKNNSLPIQKLDDVMKTVIIQANDEIQTQAKSSRKSEDQKDKKDQKNEIAKHGRSGSLNLDLGKPLEDVTRVIHESIKSKSSRETDPQSKENVEQPKIENVLFQACETINDSVKKNATPQDENPSSKNLISNETQTQAEEEEKGEVKENKGELEKYIEDNILITMINHKSTAGTQTDPNCMSEEEEEEANEDDENNDDDIPPIQVTKYSPEELHEALQKQITTQQLPPQEMREAVVDYARKQSIFKLMEEDYDTASKIDDAIAANIQSLKDDHHNIEADMLNNHLKHRLSEAESSKSSLQDQWRKKIRSFKESEENELQKIAERHEQERRLFESHWSQSATLMPFSKPSPSLLQLRSMQKAFALSHDFTNARKLKISAERKQKEESIEASKKASKSMRKEYQNLVNKQQKEISCFNELSNRKLGLLEAQRDTELRINENVRFQLASRVNKSRLIKKPMVMTPYATVKVDVRSASVTPMTYRTRSQFANYRQSVDMKMLDVKINDLHSIVKPLTPAVQKNQKKQKSPKKK